MAIIHEIKCARCDRKYSGVRSRCPFCGARRTGGGKYSDDSHNFNGKMLISVIIMSVFTIAAGILLISTPVEADAGVPETPPVVNNPEDDINKQDSLATETPPPAEETPTPTPVPDKINNIEIETQYGSKTRDITLSGRERVELKAIIDPESVVTDNMWPIRWETSNQDVFEVTEIPENGLFWKAAVLGRATQNSVANLTVTVGDPENGGMEYSIVIRVNP